MKEKQLYGRELPSKKAMLKWLEENCDKIDWNYNLYVEWYYKDEEEEEK